MKTHPSPVFVEWGDDVPGSKKFKMNPDRRVPAKE
jgi:hypothetical protein